MANEKFLDETGARHLVSKVKNMVPDVANVYRYKGSVTTYTELSSITTKSVGDVYNIEQADEANDIKAGDNIAWNGTTWDNLSGSFKIDMTNIPTGGPISNEEIDAMFE